MAISYIGSATGTTSATIPTHQVGDLIVIAAYRDGNTTAPTLPGSVGWRSPSTATGSGSTNSMRVAFKLAATTSETTGTFTNATSVAVAVYRGAAKVGGIAFASGSSTTVSYPAISSMIRTDNTSWIVGASGHRSVNTSLENAPTGMTFRNGAVDATDEIALHDTNGTVSSWSNQNVSVSGTSSGWMGLTVELVARRELADWLVIRDAVAAGSRSATLLCDGDSFTAGYNSTNNSLGSNARSASYPAVLASLFSNAPARNDSFYGTQNAPFEGFTPYQYDSRQSQTGGWTNSEVTLGYYTAGAGYREGPSSGTLSFNPGVSFDRIRVFHTSYSGSPQYTVNIGGGTLATLPMNAADAVKSTDVNCTLGTNTVNIVSAATAAFIGGMMVWNSSSPQINIINVGWSAGTVTQAAANANFFDPLPSLGVFNADLVVSMRGTNEYLNSFTEATFKSDYGSMILAMQSTAHVVLVTPHFSSIGTSQATQETYHGYIAALAAQYGCTLIEITDNASWSTFATADGNGLMSTDDLHPNGTGYASIAAIIAAVVDPSTGVDGSGSVTTPLVEVTGSGIRTSKGTGSVVIEAVSVSGSGVRTSKGTGAVSIATVEVAGLGTVGVEITGSGSVSLDPAQVSGSGIRTSKGTGSVVLDVAQVSGAGTRHSVGTGAVALIAVEVSGTGEISGVTGGTGAVLIDAVSVSGAGSIIKTATGAVQLSDILVAGSGVVSRFASGNVTFEQLQVSGTGTTQEDTSTGDGEVVLFPVLVSGAGIRQVNGSGNVILPGVIVSGQSSGFAIQGMADLIVYEITPSGEIQWVDYIPIKYRTPDQDKVNRFNDTGALGVVTIGTPAGLVPWVDYVPVVVVSTDDSKVWRIDDDGFIPVMEVDD